MSGPVPRRKSSKFYISHENFNKNNFDPYCEGSAYVISSDMAETIYKLSLNVYWHPFSTWLEDVYIGMLIKNISPRFINIASKYVPIGGQYAAWSKKAKANLLKSNLENYLFVYAESENHNFFWDLFNKKDFNRTTRFNMYSILIILCFLVAILNRRFRKFRMFLIKLC